VFYTIEEMLDEYQYDDQPAYFPLIPVTMEPGYRDFSSMPDAAIDLTMVSDC
jgi:hypothetical protein